MELNSNTIIDKIIDEESIEQVNIGSLFSEREPNLATKTENINNNNSNKNNSTIDSLDLVSPNTLTSPIPAVQASNTIVNQTGIVNTNSISDSKLEPNIIDFDPIDLLNINANNVGAAVLAQPTAEEMILNSNSRATSDTDGDVTSGLFECPDLIKSNKADYQKLIKEPVNFLTASTNQRSSIDSTAAPLDKTLSRFSPSHQPLSSNLNSLDGDTNTTQRSALNYFPNDSRNVNKSNVDANNLIAVAFSSDNDANKTRVECCRFANEALDEKISSSYANPILTNLSSNIEDRKQASAFVGDSKKEKSTDCDSA